MSEPAAAVTLEERVRLRDRVLNLYSATILLMIVVILVSIAYSIHLGPLVGPGVEESFGLALALMFLAAALIAHLVDWTYRVWPTGRTVTPPFPGIVTDRGIANLIKVAIFVAVAGGVAYVIAQLVTS